MLALADEAALTRLAIAAAQRRSPLRAIELSDCAVEGMPVRPRTVSERLISFRAPTKHRRHYSMPQPRRRRYSPQPDRRRALELLVASRDGCTEAIMLAHGFPVPLLVDLCVGGLAIATPERMVAGGRTVEVVRLKITDAGRRALAGQ
jgi:hypothetical protein